MVTVMAAVIRVKCAFFLVLLVITAMEKVVIVVNCKTAQYGGEKKLINFIRCYPKFARRMYLSKYDTEAIVHRKYRSNNTTMYGKCEMYFDIKASIDNLLNTDSLPV